MARRRFVCVRQTAAAETSRDRETFALIVAPSPRVVAKPGGPGERCEMLLGSGDGAENIRQSCSLLPLLLPPVTVKARRYTLYLEQLALPSPAQFGRVARTYRQ